LRVVTDRGRYEAGQAVLCAAPGSRGSPDPRSRRSSRSRARSCSGSTCREPRAFSPPRCPVWIWELQDADAVIYGFPAIDGPSGGAKVATEQYSRTLPPSRSGSSTGRGAESSAMHERLVARHLRARARGGEGRAVHLHGERRISSS
jgi:sarcosine oxidase